MKIFPKRLPTIIICDHRRHYSQEDESNSGHMKMMVNFECFVLVQLVHHLPTRVRKTFQKGDFEINKISDHSFLLSAIARHPAHPFVPAMDPVLLLTSAVAAIPSDFAAAAPEILEVLPSALGSGGRLRV
mmetsp:Transcript_39047/g.117355  ORF Transcript_39047/g.117355 Transcript_39047/m.117355 type:complete len:130 (+) Transcript_39047:719-1108(+)